VEDTRFGLISLFELRLVPGFSCSVKYTAELGNLMPNWSHPRRAGVLLERARVYEEVSA
jgi:hypothetical protein